MLDHLRHSVFVGGERRPHVRVGPALAEVRIELQARGATIAQTAGKQTPLGRNVHARRGHAGQYGRASSRKCSDEVPRRREGDADRSLREQGVCSPSQ
eukprot:509029-Pleurochrysis_carterae.AAC.2